MSFLVSLISLNVIRENNISQIICLGMLLIKFKSDSEIWINFNGIQLLLFLTYIKLKFFDFKNIFYEKNYYSASLDNEITH